MDRLGLIWFVQICHMNSLFTICRFRGSGRPESLLEQFVWTISPPTGVTEGGGFGAGTPFVVVGAPGDYVFGGEGMFYSFIYVFTTVVLLNRTCKWFKRRIFIGINRL